MILSPVLRPLLNSRPAFPTTCCTPNAHLLPFLSQIQNLGTRVVFKMCFLLCCSPTSKPFLRHCLLIQPPVLSSFLFPLYPGPSPPAYTGVLYLAPPHTHTHLSTLSVYPAHSFQTALPKVKNPIFSSLCSKIINGSLLMKEIEHKRLCHAFKTLWPIKMGIFEDYCPRRRHAIWTSGEKRQKGVGIWVGYEQEESGSSSRRSSMKLSSYRSHTHPSSKEGPRETAVDAKEQQLLWIMLLKKPILDWSRFIAFWYTSGPDSLHRLIGWAWLASGSILTLSGCDSHCPGILNVARVAQWHQCPCQTCPVFSWKQSQQQKATTEPFLISN